MLKILSGVYQPDEGSIRFGEREVRFGNALDSIRAGVAVIYQELHLAEHMTVAENILLGHLPTKMGVLNRSEMRKQAADILKQVGVEIDPNAMVHSLSLAQQQMVEIAKALSRDAQLIAFDEPTSSLSMKETEALFAMIEELRRQGKAIIYISHRLDEVFRICDQASVLRDGKLVQEFPTLDGIDAQEIVRSMVGRSIEDIYGYVERSVGDVVLEVQQFQPHGIAAPLDFSIRAGEVLGVFGVVGSGRTELLKGIYGAAKLHQGQVLVGGKPIQLRRECDAIREGIVLCPEDRKLEGIITGESVKENINVSARRNHSWLGTVIQSAWEAENADNQIRLRSIKTPSRDQAILNLSGGNQQKAILGRWLSESIKVLLLDEPTRGIDVGSKREIYDTIYELARQGIGVMFVSSDLLEVLGVCDRVLVLCEGRITGQLTRAQMTEEAVINLAIPHGNVESVGSVAG